MDDRALVAACIAGDGRAWNAFVEHYRPVVLRVAYAVLRHANVGDARGIAEDLVSDLFAELLVDERQALTRFGHPFSLKSWLGMIARRKALHHVRDRRHDPVTLRDPHRFPADARSVASEVARVETRALVRDGLKDLAPRDRRVLQLFYERGCTYRDMAVQLNLPLARIGTMLARARRRLARRLEPAT